MFAGIANNKNYDGVFVQGARYSQRGGEIRVRLGV